MRFRELSAIAALLALSWPAGARAAGATNAPAPPPHVAYLTPEEEAKTFVMQDGYSLELVLSDPIIKEPVISVFDGNGRLFVAEMRSYMQDVDGTNQRCKNRPGLRALVEQARRRLRQARGVRGQLGFAAHATAGRGRRDHYRDGLR